MCRMYISRLLLAAVPMEKGQADRAMGRGPLMDRYFPDLASTIGLHRTTDRALLPLGGFSGQLYSGPLRVCQEVIVTNQGHTGVFLVRFSQEETSLHTSSWL